MGVWKGAVKSQEATVLVASFCNIRFLLRLTEGNLFVISKAGRMCRVRAFLNGASLTASAHSARTNAEPNDMMRRHPHRSKWRVGGMARWELLPLTCGALGDWEDLLSILVSGSLGCGGDASAVPTRGHCCPILGAQAMNGYCFLEVPGLPQVSQSVGTLERMQTPEFKSLGGGWG